MFADTRNVTRRSSFSKAIQLPCQLSKSNPPKNTSGSASHACHQCTGAHKARLCHVMGFGSKMNTKVAKQLSPLPFGIGPSRLRESPQTDWLPSRKTRLTRGRRMPPPRLSQLLLLLRQPSTSPSFTSSSFRPPGSGKQLGARACVAASWPPSAAFMCLGREPKEGKSRVPRSLQCHTS